MKKKTIDIITDIVDSASIMSFYVGRVLGNFHRGFRGCYTPIMENEERQDKMQQYEAEMRRKNKQIYNSLETKTVGFS